VEYSKFSQNPGAQTLVTGVKKEDPKPMPIVPDPSTPPAPEADKEEKTKEKK